jgi:3-hydroxyacyl-CoA dehydrogenase/enoyl-CoA hydratase/3-hydroxybutyryl-CoA epimerase
MDATTVHTSLDATGVLIVTLDVPNKPVNTCTPALLNDLSDAVLEIEKTKPIGVVFASAKAKSFNAGADLFEIRGMTRDAVADYLAVGQALFDRIAHLPMPTVAANNGDCLGGGFELALACRYRVAADVGSISIGLPETKLGLIPAWGGTNRLPRVIGLSKALPILLAGKTMPPRKALKAGLIDEIVRPEVLLAAAKRWATTHPARHRPSRIDQGIAHLPLVRHRVLDTARRKTLDATHGHYPAPLRLLDVIETSFKDGMKTGLSAERQAILEMTDADAGKNLLRLFFLRQGAKKRAAAQVNAPSADVKYAAVIGGGTMGAGIAYALLRAGIFVRLVEVNPQAVSAALGRVKKMLDADVAATRIDPLTARHIFNHLSPTTDWTGLELADIAIEAVVETLDAKREVFAKLDRLTRPTAVLASNTSSLRIADLAEVTQRPERVIGLHFFNPVPKMPLVEIVRALHSNDTSLATAISLANRIGKTPIVCADAPGFVVNRILIPYLSEAMLMAAEGMPIPTIDDAMKRWGMPMGPFELMDEIGLDVGAHVLKTLHSSASDNVKVVTAMNLALQRQWLGKKTSRGFYLHGPKKSKEAELNEDFASALAGGASAPDEPNDDAAKLQQAEDNQWRLVLPMVNEMAKLLDEDVVDSTDTIDLATVFGTGLAPFRGGLAHFADSIGADAIVHRLETLASEFGPRFTPAPLLREWAQSHDKLAPHATLHPQPANYTSVT